MTMMGSSYVEKNPAVPSAWARSGFLSVTGNKKFASQPSSRQHLTAHMPILDFYVVSKANL